jgi:CHASE3 domain sensor protein
MRNNTLVRRIGSGYALLIILLACAVGITIIQVSRIRVACDRLDTVRLPAVQSGIEITNGANHSSAALRGWVFLRNASFKSEYEQAWAEQIEAPLQRLDTVLERDTLGRERLAEIHKAIKDFRREEETALNSTLEQAEPVVSKRSGPALAA